MSLTVQRSVVVALIAVLPTLGQPTASDQRSVRVSADELIETVRTLADPSLEGRRTGTPGNAKAREWIASRFRDIGLAPFGDSHLMPFVFTRDADTIEGVNIVGTCRGTGAGDDGVMVITAHYDHVGVRDGTVHPGADDNASGVAVMLALARACRAQPWKRDAIFVAFDAEELGLRGARAFVAKPPIAQDRLALNVNLDMVSRSAKRELYAAGTYHRPELKPVLEPVASRAPIMLLFGHDQPQEKSGGMDDWTLQSDHGAFHQAGIPFVYFGVEDHPDYHKPTDTADRIDKTFLGDVATTILDAVTVLDGALPLAKR